MVPFSFLLSSYRSLLGPTITYACVPSLVLKASSNKRRYRWLKLSWR